MTDWPNFWANLVIAIATVGALGWAIYLGWGERKRADRLAKEIAQRAERDDLMRLAEAQALMVRFAVEWVTGEHGVYEGAWRLTNRSDVPISNVVITWSADHLTSDGVVWPKFATQPRVGGEVDPRRSLGRTSLKGVVRTTDGSSEGENEHQRLVPLHADFTDHASSRWRITTDGELLLLSPRQIRLAAPGEA